MQSEGLDTADQNSVDKTKLLEAYKDSQVSDRIKSLEIYELALSVVIL